MLPSAPSSSRLFGAFASGAAVGMLGGLIGLGGAEFRLPLLIGLFSFGPLSAVILNKAMSLLVVTSSIPFRAMTIPFAELIGHWQTIANLLGGSLIGAWAGASWALRLKTPAFYGIISGLLLVMAVALLAGHGAASAGHARLSGPLLVLAGLGAGFCVGLVASLLGVAGGELLIPTLVLLFGADVKLAGSLSLLVSLPTMIVGFARYSRDSSFATLRREAGFCSAMALGSVIGAYAGGRLLPWVDSAWLLPALAAILVWSAWKMWRHRAEHPR